MADETPAGETKHTFQGTWTVEPILPPGTRIAYSDWVAVQSTHYEVLFTFCQMDIPLLEAGDTEAVQKFVENPVVPAPCIARIAVPVAQISALYGSLRDHMRRLGLLEQFEPKTD